MVDKLSGDLRSRFEGSPRFGLLADYDGGGDLANEVRDRKPVRILVICLAGENRSRLIADVLNDRGENVKEGGRKMNYLSEYSGIGAKFRLTREDLDDFSPEAIIFATRDTRIMFEKRFPEWAEKINNKNILGRVIGLSDSRIALGLESGDLALVAELKEKIKKRLINMGFEGLSGDDLESYWKSLV